MSLKNLYIMFSTHGFILFRKYSTFLPLTVVNTHLTMIVSTLYLGPQQGMERNMQHLLCSPAEPEQGFFTA